LTRGFRYGEQKANMIFSGYGYQLFRVTVQDLDGTSHTAEVTASSLFEAVAQGLAALRRSEWVEGIDQRFGLVKVSVANVRVEHQVKIADFTKWLDRPGRSPREVTKRQRIRSILGMPLAHQPGVIRKRAFSMATLVIGDRLRELRDTAQVKSGREQQIAPAGVSRF
jgi:hypothetical protein